MAEEPGTAEPAHTVINDMLGQRDCFHVVDVKGNTAFIKMPERRETCLHSPHIFLSTLGGGSFGRVMSISDSRCVKTFGEEEWFFHEMILNDAINLGKLKHPLGNWKSLLSMDDACMSCRTITYPRYQCTVEQFPFWRITSAETVAQTFTGLVGAVEFLNQTCGIFHSDISTSNIFVRTGKNEKDLRSLVLGDVGVGSFHTGNTCTSVVVVCNKTNAPKHKLPGGRDPFYVGKDIFKTASLLYRCYCVVASPASGTEDLGSSDSPVGMALARNTDLGSLGYCLFDVLEKMLDISRKEPTMAFLDRCRYRRPHPLYFLTFLAPKVVMCKMLSEKWGCRLNLGMDGSGDGAYLTLPSPHRQAFKEWCQALERQYLKLLFGYQSFKIRSASLRQLTQTLIANDRFGLPGE